MTSTKRKTEVESQNFGQFCRWLRMVFGDRGWCLSDPLDIHMYKNQFSFLSTIYKVVNIFLAF